MHNGRGRDLSLLVLSDLPDFERSPQPAPSRLNSAPMDGVTEMADLTHGNHRGNAGKGGG